MKVYKDTPFEVGHLVWQVSPGRHTLILAIKATFAIVNQAACTIAEEQTLVSGEMPFDDEEDSSIRLDSDLAVHKPRGECFLAGTCHPPGGRPATTSAISFQVGSVMKSLAVFGDRYWSRGRVTSGSMTEPRPFTSMQLRYERSFGGAGYDKNPVGIGIANVETEQGTRRPLPNIEHPRALITSPDARPEPAGAFPIPRTWSARTSRTGTYDAIWFKTRWPYFPEDFDWAYFNAAPLDQQIDGYWRGDEEIQLQNLHPAAPLIKTRLPSLRARCFVESVVAARADFREVPLQLDTITVDADAMNVLCVWRGVTDVANEKLDDVARVFAMHESLSEFATPDACRARFERVVRTEDGEEEAFAPEPIPAITLPPAPAPVPPPTAAIEAAPSMPAALVALLAAAGLDPEKEEPPAPPPTAEDIEKLKDALRAAGQEVPPELDQILAPPPPVVPPPIPPPPLRDLRTQVIAKRARGEQLEDMDLTDADLSSLDLRGVSLAKSVLQGARLVASRLDGAKLDGAQLGNADVTGAVFYGASMVGADLTGASGAQVSFDEAVLTDAVLNEAKFPRSAFRRTKLEKAEMVGGDFSGSVFEGATMDGADLSDAKLDDASFTGASMAEATLERASAERSVFDGCNMAKLRASGKTKFAEAKFRRVTAPGSHWAGAILDKTDFSFSDLEAADFSEASLIQATLNGCNIKNGKFPSAVMVGATMIESDVFAGLFESTDLSHADLRGSNFFGAEFWKAKTDSVRLELANLKRTKLQGRS